MEENIIDLLKRNIGVEEIFKTAFKSGDLEVELNSSKIKEAVKLLKQEGYNHIITIIPVEEDGFIKLIYFLERNGSLAALKIRVPCDNPIVDTVSDVFKTAESFEREARDLYGVNFKNLKADRIIAPDNWPEKPVMKRT